MELQIRNCRNTYSCRLLSNIYITFLWLFINNSCREKAEFDSIYTYLTPNYKLAQIHSVNDTISFPLNEHTYNSIKSFNLFSSGTEEYISFYDDRSKSVNIYHFRTRNLIKNIPLKKIIGKFYKTTAYCKNFDSIFVTNKNKLYMLDSSGKTKLSIDFVENTRLAYASLENTFPPFFTGNLLYSGVRPYLDDESFKALRKWKVLCAFDLKNKKATLYYHLPGIYLKNLYGSHFLDYNYCNNEKGNFVFSFPADTNIYETNLTNYNASFFARSQSQAEAIKPLTKKDLENDDTSFKKYLTQDSYGPIYYDPYHKRYLRVVKSRISEEAYNSKNRLRENRFIIFNEHLQIIGESPLPPKTSYTSLFFTKQGGIYARVNAQDEFALNFVRLSYKENGEEPGQLTKNNSQSSFK